MRFEHYRQPILPLSHFIRRLIGSFAVGLGLIAFSLGVGIVGYRQSARRCRGSTRSSTRR